MAPGGGEPEPQVPAEAFDVTFTSNLTVSGKVLRARLAGVLVGSPVWTMNSERWRSYRIAEPDVTVSENGRPSTAIAGIAEPFLVRIGDTGQLEELAFARTASVEARHMLQALATFIQFACPEDAARASWTASERDGTGRYDARYERGDGAWIRKTKLGYADVMFPFRIERSDVNFRTTCSGLPDEISGAEASASEALGLHSDSSVLLQRRSAAGVLPARVVGRLAQGYERATLTAAPLPAETVAEPPDDVGTRLATALARLDGAGSSSLSWKTLSALARRMHRHPDELGELASDFREHPAHRHALCQLLVNIGSPGSHQLIDQWLDDGALPDDARLELLTQLLWAHTVSTTTIDRVHALARSASEIVSASAANTEGSLLGLARTLGVPDVDRLVDRYVEASRHATSIRLRTSYLHGLSYVGAEPSLAELRRAIEGKDAAVRVAAVGALEDVKDPRVEDWIATRLVDDRDASVRARAVRACATRVGPPCRKALVGALANDSSAGVRMKVVGALVDTGMARSDDAPLRRAARSDGNAIVRKAAGRALEKLSDDLRNSSTKAPSGDARN